MSVASVPVLAAVATAMALATGYLLRYVVEARGRGGHGVGLFLLAMMGEMWVSAVLYLSAPSAGRLVIALAVSGGLMVATAAPLLLVLLRPVPPRRLRRRVRHRAAPFPRAPRGRGGRRTRPGQRVPDGVGSPARVRDRSLGDRERGRRGGHRPRRRLPVVPVLDGGRNGGDRPPPREPAPGAGTRDPASPGCHHGVLTAGTRLGDVVVARAVRLERGDDRPVRLRLRVSLQEPAALPGPLGVPRGHAGGLRRDDARVVRLVVLRLRPDVRGLGDRRDGRLLRGRLAPEGVLRPGRRAVDGAAELDVRRAVAHLRRRGGDGSGTQPEPGPGRLRRRLPVPRTRRASGGRCRERPAEHVLVPRHVRRRRPGSS